MQAGEIPQYPPLHHEGGSRPDSNEYSPPPNLDAAQQRKRTFSTISNDYSPSYQPQRHSVGWEPPRHLPPPSAYQMSQQVSGEATSSNFRTHYSPNGLAPQPVWSTAPDTAVRPNTSFGSSGHADQNYSEQNLEWDDTLVNG